ncbi:MAG: hypothetical protein ABJA78_14905 [Ferruginibacter sp.]
MKKIIIGITALIYLAASSGIVMEIHHCMGKISGVDFFATAAENKCGKCGMKEKKGCCQDEFKIYKLQDTHKNVTNNIEFNAAAVLALPSYGNQDVTFSLQKISLALQNHSPPDLSGPSLRVRNCVFRI